jgi:hypothetical protein
MPGEVLVGGESASSALELVNHFIDEAINDLKVIKDMQDSAARLISVATKITAAYEDKVS